MKIKLGIYFLIVLLIFTIFVTNNFKKEIVSQNNFTVKKYENTIALYNGDNIVRIYEDIVFDLLPQYDKNLLIEGIPVMDESEIKTIIADFDG